MSAHSKGNPERIMLILFPLITLGLFAAGAIVFNLLPRLFGQ